MEEIKFRVWNKRLGIMGKVYNIDFDHALIMCENIDTAITHTFGLVDCELLQYTGVKDSHGADIYKDDILKAYHYTDNNGKDEFLYHIIKWSDRFNGWRCLNARSMSDDDGSVNLFVYRRSHKHLYVAGNINQNPGLLSGKQ